MLEWLSSLCQRASALLRRRRLERDLQDEIILAAFAGGALLLAAIGRYGLLAFSIAERRREIAVRLALGAAPPAIVRMVIRQALTLVSVGVIAGAVAAVAAANAAASLLYGTRMYDSMTFGIVPLVLLATALVACALPAYRASRVDSLAALRAE